MDGQIKEDLETILSDLLEAYSEAEQRRDEYAILKTHVRAKFRERVQRVHNWLDAQT